MTIFLSFVSFLVIFFSNVILSGGDGCSIFKKVTYQDLSKICLTFCDNNNQKQSFFLKKDHPLITYSGRLSGYEQMHKFPVIDLSDLNESSFDDCKKVIKLTLDLEQYYQEVEEDNVHEDNFTLESNLHTLLTSVSPEFVKYFIWKDEFFDQVVPHILKKMRYKNNVNTFIGENKDLFSEYLFQKSVVKYIRSKASLLLRKYQKDEVRKISTDEYVELEFPHDYDDEYIVKMSNNGMVCLASHLYVTQDLENRVRCMHVVDMFNMKELLHIKQILSVMQNTEICCDKHVAVSSDGQYIATICKHEGRNFTLFFHTKEGKQISFRVILSDEIEFLHSSNNTFVVHTKDWNGIEDLSTHMLLLFDVYKDKLCPITIQKVLFDDNQDVENFFRCNLLYVAPYLISCSREYGDVNDSIKFTVVDIHKKEIITLIDDENDHEQKKIIVLDQQYEIGKSDNIVQKQGYFLHTDNHNNLKAVLRFFVTKDVDDALKLIPLYLSYMRNTQVYNDV